MDVRDLTAVECAVYDAARAEAQADRWRIDAELRERDGDDASLPRKYQRKHEADAADRWRQVQTLKAQSPAFVAV